ncbi:MAG TPA: galactose-1-phosphate uridylyltransferase [Bdellovibrionota bacterium]|nr:galactose-1-phosphate uridylyltransferase [Bdellovibrionota bacterium]
MSEFRKSTITGRWVIIAEERSNRPNAFRHYPIEDDPAESCPFCPGHEQMTPAPVLTYSAPGGTNSAWSLRVVPNRFPALRIEGELDQRPSGIYDKMHGLGAHEVVVETPEHQTDMAHYGLPQMVQVFQAYRDRMSDLFKDRRFTYVLAFKNFGSAAGATLSHSHSQLIALPVLPTQLEREIAGASKYHEFRGRCFFCDAVAQELIAGERIVVQNDHFVAFTPFASRFPFELQIIPKTHGAFYWTLTRNQMEGFAEILRDVLRRYKLALKNPPYSYMIHTAPPDYRTPEVFHWHAEIMPKLTEVGGFEWGSGFYINPKPPEEAARILRELELVMNVPERHLLPSPKGRTYGY